MTARDDADGPTPVFGSAAHLADIAEHAGVLLHSADAAGYVRWANAAWYAALGYDAADLVRGLHVRDLAGPEFVPQLATTMATAKAGGAMAFDATLRRKDGSMLIVAGTISAYRDASTGATRWSRASFRDVTAERQAEAQARQAERRFRVTLESLVDGVAVLDAAGAVEYVNAAAARLLGVTREQLVGRPLLALPWRMFDRDGVERPRDTHPALVALRTREPVVADRFVVQRGPAMRAAAPADPTAPPITGRLWVEASAVCVDPEDPASPVIASFRDVTAEERSQRLQEQLVGIVAHELRAPLTSLKGALTMLAAAAADTAPPAPASELLPMARRNAERLERLVTDLLDLERLDQGQLALTITDVPLAALLDDVYDVLAVAAQQAGVTLVREAADGTVPADASRLAQVLRNLGGNAIKFSPPGGRVTLAASVDASGVIVSVTDE
nr:PAS domain S-box protein [Gemmatimonadaceae bacterium]